MFYYYLENFFRNVISKQFIYPFHRMIDGCTRCIQFSRYTRTYRYSVYEYIYYKRTYIYIPITQTTIHFYQFNFHSTHWPLNPHYWQWNLLLSVTFMVNIKRQNFTVIYSVHIKRFIKFSRNLVSIKTTSNFIKFKINIFKLIVSIIILTRHHIITLLLYPI